MRIDPLWRHDACNGHFIGLVLIDEPRRNALEQPDLERLQTCSWQAIAMPLRKLLNGLTGCPDKRGLLQ